MIQYIIILFGIIGIFSQHVSAAQLQLNSQTAKKGEIITFTVFIHDAPDPVDAFGFDMIYDPSVMIYQSGSTQKGSLISEGFQFFNVNNIQLGCIRIGGVETGDAIIPKGSTGTLIMVQYSIIGNQNTTIQLDNLKDDLKTWSIQNGQLIIQSEDESEDKDETIQDNSIIDGEDETTQNDGIIEKQSTEADNQETFFNASVTLGNNQTKSTISNIYINSPRETVSAKEAAKHYQMDISDNSNAHQTESIQKNQLPANNFSVNEQKIKSYNNKEFSEHEFNKTKPDSSKNEKHFYKKIPTNVQEGLTELSNSENWGALENNRALGKNISNVATSFHKVSSSTLDILVVLIVLMLIVQIGILVMLFLVYRQVIKKEREGVRKIIHIKKSTDPKH